MCFHVDRCDEYDAIVYDVGRVDRNTMSLIIEACAGVYNYIATMGEIIGLFSNEDNTTQYVTDTAQCTTNIKWQYSRDNTAQYSTDIRRHSKDYRWNETLGAPVVILEVVSIDCNRIDIDRVFSINGYETFIKGNFTAFRDLHSLLSSVLCEKKRIMDASPFFLFILKQLLPTDIYRTIILYLIAPRKCVRYQCIVDDWETQGNLYFGGT